MRSGVVPNFEWKTILTTQNSGLRNNEKRKRNRLEKILR